MPDMQSDSQTCAGQVVPGPCTDCAADSTPAVAQYSDRDQEAEGNRACTVVHGQQGDLPQAGALGGLAQILNLCMRLAQVYAHQKSIDNTYAVYVRYNTREM